MAETKAHTVSPLLEGADFAAVTFTDRKFHTIVRRGALVARDRHPTEAQALSYIGLTGGSPDPLYTPDGLYIRTAHTKENT